MSALSISIGPQTDSSERPVCHVIAVFFMGLYVGSELQFHMFIKSQLVAC